MIALRRLIQRSFSPHPMCAYFACQKFVNEFSSNACLDRRKKVTEESSLVMGTSSSEERRGKRKQSSSDRNEGLDVLSLQSNSDEDNGINNQTGSIKDLVKQLKLLQKGSKGPRRQCIMDKNVAKTIVTYLKRDLGKNDIVVDFCPGLGILTETLLSDTTNRVVVYERQATLKSHLEKILLPQYSPRLQIDSHDFHKFYGYYIASQKEPERAVLNNFLSPMLRKVGTEYSPVKILGVIYDVKFINNLIYAYTFQCCLYENISPDLYLCIPQEMYKRINQNLNATYKKINLVLQYYFDLEMLQEFPMESFYPFFTKSKANTEEKEDGIYLIKISPRKDFFDMIPRQEIESFYFFIHTLSRIKKTDSLISWMERWVPDCGPEIIKRGIHVFAHPRDLTAEQFFMVYKIFTSLPSYQESTFHYQRQQFIAKVAKKTYIGIEEKPSQEILDIEDHSFLET